MCELERVGGNDQRGSQDICASSVPLRHLQRDFFRLRGASSRPFCPAPHSDGEGGLHTEPPVPHLRSGLVAARIELPWNSGTKDSHREGRSCDCQRQAGQTCRGQSTSQAVIHRYRHIKDGRWHHRGRRGTPHTIGTGQRPKGRPRHRRDGCRHRWQTCRPVPSHHSLGEGQGDIRHRSG